MRTCAQSCTKNTFTSDEIAKMHRYAANSSVRKYICCDLPGNTPREITDYQKWDINTKVYTDIIVKSGGELELTCELYLPQDGRIIVERGGRLNINGGTVSFNKKEYDDCPDELWGGIQVWGNSSVDHAIVDVYGALVPENPGIVLIQNEATIERARTAISTKRKDDGVSWPEVQEYWGGIVVAENSNFVNNKRGAEFMKYTFENKSSFNNCVFTTDNEVGETGITMWGIRGIEIKNCDFTKLTKRGILAYDASGIIDDGNTFAKLDFGINAIATEPLSGNLQIGSDNDNLARNDFSMSNIGVASEGLDKLRVYNNDFHDLNFGVTLNGDNSYIAFNNNFDDLVIGLDNINCGRKSKLAQCNDYNNANDGIRIEGDNTGFRFRQETFNTEIDLLMVGHGDNDEVKGEIFQFQGTPNNAVYNLFSENPEYDRIMANTEECNLFIYHHPDPTIDERLVPECELFNGPVGCFQNNTYINILSFTDQEQECLIIEGQPEWDNPNFLTNIYDEIDTQKSLIDGGDKNGLLNAISEIGSATLQIFSDAAPYVSDEVLLTMLEGTETNSNLESILLDNAPLTDEVMNAAKLVVSDLTFNNLKDIKINNPVSDRMILENQIASLEMEKDEVLRDLVYKMMEDGDYSAAENLLIADNTVQGDRWLYGLKIKLGELTVAATLLNAMPSNTQEDLDFKAVQNINLAWKSAPEDFVLSADQKDILFNIADGYTPSSAYARSILIYLTGAVFYPPFPENYRSDRSENREDNQNEQANHSQRNQFLVYPNPATDLLQIQIPENFVGTSSLMLYSGAGNMQKQIKTTIETKVEINTADLSSGIYWVLLRNNNGQQFQTKVIINK